MTRSLLLAALLGSAIVASPALAAPITYTSTGVAADTIHNVKVSYTITTNGKLDDVSLADIIGSTFTFESLDSSGEFSFPTFTATNSLYLYDDTRLFATATELSFNFAGGGGFNAGTQNCVAINVCDGSQSAGTTDVARGLVYALAGAQSTDDDSVVFHGDNLPVRELDSFADSGNADGGNFNLREGFFNKVSAERTPIAVVSAPDGAVPEPATWATMTLGFGLVGAGLRRRATVRTTTRFA